MPDDVVAALDSGGRPAGRVTLGACSFHTTIGVIGGRCLIPLSAQHREPQETTIPVDLATALDNKPDARRLFDAQHAGKKGH